MPKIIYLNEMKLSEDEMDANFNDRRKSLLPHIENFISTHPKFLDKEVSIRFAEKGVSSLVCIIDASGEKCVLKIPLSLVHSAAEGRFLQAWGKIGVKTPHIFEEGLTGEHSYTLMEYIDAPVLSDAYTKEEMIEKGIYSEMGATLRLMHTLKAQGYGKDIEGRPEYKKFSEWWTAEEMQKRLGYTKKHNLLGDEYGSLDRALEILIEHTEKEGVSSYCHNDFALSNIFATHPITVYDPHNPGYNTGYMDLGRTIINFLSEGIFPKQLIEVYFNNEPYSKKVLHAAILLNIYIKFPYSHKKNRTRNLENWQKYLLENKELLL